MILWQFPASSDILTAGQRQPIILGYKNTGPSFCFSTNRTFSGYCYWVTFINNYSTYCFVLPSCQVWHFSAFQTLQGICPTWGCADVLPMCMCRKTSVLHLTHTWKCASLLAIQMGTKAWSSITPLTPLPSAQSFLNMLTLMNAIWCLLRGLRRQHAWCAPLHYWPP